MKEDSCLLISCYQITKSPQTVFNNLNSLGRVLPQGTLHNLVNSSVEVALHNCVDNGLVFGVQNRGERLYRLLWNIWLSLVEVRKQMVENEGPSKFAYVFLVLISQVIQRWVDFEFYLSVLNRLAQQTDADLKDLDVQVWKLINLLRHEPSNLTDELENRTWEVRLQL